MNREKGFSLTELMVALGVSAIGVGVAIPQMQTIMDSLNSARVVAEEEMDANDTQHAVWSLLRGITPSLNNLSLKDDNGLGFFELYSDLPAFALAPTNRSRTLTLDATHKTSITLILNTKKTKYPTNLYNPLDAYSSDATVSVNVNGAVTYQSVNYRGVMSGLYADIWSANSVFLLQSPIPLRPVALNGTVDMTVVPRSLFYVGKVNQGKTDIESIDTTILPTLIRTHPMNSNITLKTPDDFFRWLPPSGSAPIVTLTAVRIVRIDLDKDTGDLWLAEYKGEPNFATQANNGTKIGTKVRALKFVRPLISLPTVGFEIDRM